MCDISSAAFLYFKSRVSHKNRYKISALPIFSGHYNYFLMKNRVRHQLHTSMHRLLMKIRLSVLYKFSQGSRQISPVSNFFSVLMLLMISLIIHTSIFSSTFIKTFYICFFHPQSIGRSIPLLAIWGQLHVWALIAAKNLLIGTWHPKTTNLPRTMQADS